DLGNHAGHHHVLDRAAGSSPPASAAARRKVHRTLHTRGAGGRRRYCREHSGYSGSGRDDCGCEVTARSGGIAQAPDCGDRRYGCRPVGKKVKMMTTFLTVWTVGIFGAIVLALAIYLTAIAYYLYRAGGSNASSLARLAGGLIAVRD